MAPSLPEHLAEQLRIVTDDPAALAIGEFFIGNLNEDGYLQLGVGGVGADNILHSSSLRQESSE